MSTHPSSPYIRYGDGITSTIEGMPSTKAYQIVANVNELGVPVSYGAYNKLNGRTDYVIGPTELGDFMSKANSRLNEAYYRQKGANARPFEQASGRFVMELASGNFSSAASAYADSWLEALQDPHWILSTTMNLANASLIRRPIGTLEREYLHTLDSLPKGWQSNAAVLNIAPTQANAEGLASALAKWATARNAKASGAASVYIDANGGVWTGLSKNANKGAGMFTSLTEGPIQRASAEATDIGLDYVGTCAELQAQQSYFGAFRAVPQGGYIGAAQVGSRGGFPAGTVMNACDSCTWVNGKFGVGFRDNEARLIPPYQKR